MKVAESKDSLVGGVDLYPCQSTLIALQGLDDRSARCFLFNTNAASWGKVPFTGVPHGYMWASPTREQAGDRVLFQQGYLEDDRLIMNVAIGRLTGSIAVKDVTEKKWTTATRVLFGNTKSSNVKLTSVPGRREFPELGIGTISGQDINIPYCVEGFTCDASGRIVDRGPYVNGLFHSADSGTTWNLELIADFEANLPMVCKTEKYYYYCAEKMAEITGQGCELWYARKPIDGALWDTPKAVTKTFCDSGLYWKYVAQAEDDKIHLCWLDRRHEKRRLSLVYSQRQNYEIVYSQRKDSDVDWSKNIILSEGLLYSYSPTMSVQGGKIVAVWAGIPTAQDGHSEYGPNDIYCATSKDAGKTWTKHLKLTDGAKDGITSGKPAVALLNGIIHLFYIQGKINSQQLSPGLTKLNQPPWPIYYIQKPFPD